MYDVKKKFYSISYLEMYERDIAPKLRDIDLLVKTSEDYISVKDTAHYLDMTEDDVRNIMEAEKISIINRKTFFTIMKNGSSHICKLFKRETDCGSPYVYTREDIAYIFGIDIETIQKVCDNLGLLQITDYTLPLLMAEIPVLVSV